jgi:hypothetical protein
MSRNAIIAAGLACILLSGCGSSDKGGDAAVAAAAGGMPANWKATDACSIVDKGEMGEVMKSAVTETSLAMVHEPDTSSAATSECSYILADGGRASVMTRWSPIDDNTAESIATTRSTMASTIKAFSDKPIEDVPNVGKAAFFVPKINQFNVFLDDARMVIITLPSAPDATAKDQAIALAGKAG